MPYNIEAVTALQESLNATNVLSDDYKSRIVQYALAAHSEGYKLAQAQDAERVSPDQVEFTITTPVTPGLFSLSSDSAPAQDEVPANRRLGVTTTEQEKIKEVMENAVAFEQPVVIDYVDEVGNHTYDREVLPFEYEAGTGWYSPAIVARDVEKDEVRRFRLDRVQKVIG